MIQISSGVPSFVDQRAVRFGRERRQTRVLKERIVVEPAKRQRVSIFVDRSRHQWVVLDRDGNYWTVPSTENAWELRQPFQFAEDTELEPIPGHYKPALGLPLN
jgi:hypothetical protein